MPTKLRVKAVFIELALTGTLALWHAELTGLVVTASGTYCQAESNPNHRTRTSASIQLQIRLSSYLKRRARLVDIKTGSRAQHDGRMGRRTPLRRAGSDLRQHCAWRRET